MKVKNHFTRHMVVRANNAVRDAKSGRFVATLPRNAARTILDSKLTPEEIKHGYQLARRVLKAA